MARYIKIPVDFFDGEPIRAIEELPDASSIILLYIDLLCASYEKNRKGIFSVADIPLPDDVLANMFRAEDIGEKLAVLESFELINRNERSIHVFKFWEDKHDRNSVRYKRWRADVFQKDGYKCQSCGTRKDLQAHHIIPWRKDKSLRYEPSNGMTLCRKCHLDAHGGCWNG